MVEHLEFVRNSYAARAREYVSVLGSIEHAAQPDLDLVRRWAHDVDGPVLDVGCGPGQWTNYLSGLGVEVEGLDPVAEFIESARATYPGTLYRIARAEDLGVADGAIGGILAWYSLIHTDPARIDEPLMEFARCVKRGGGLVLGFFTGPKLASFDHAVVGAYSWPMDLLAERVEEAGFTVTQTETRNDPGSRPHGALSATRG